MTHPIPPPPPPNVPAPAPPQVEPFGLPSVDVFYEENFPHLPGGFDQSDRFRHWLFVPREPWNIKSQLDKVYLDLRFLYVIEANRTDAILSRLAAWHAYLDQTLVKLSAFVTNLRKEYVSHLISCGDASSKTEAQKLADASEAVYPWVEKMRWVEGHASTISKLLLPAVQSYNANQRQMIGAAGGGHVSGPV